jgi:hypothetical protein
MINDYTQGLYVFDAVKDPSSVPSLENKIEAW